MKRKIILSIISGIMAISCGQKGQAENRQDNSLQNKEQSITQQQPIQNSENNKTGTEKRFGSEVTGFIDYPEGWVLFKDPNATPTAMQISKNGVDIITLDKSPIQGANAGEALQNMYNGLVKTGFITKENAQILSGKVNGYDGLMLNIAASDGKALMMIFVDYNNKVYYIAVEGSPDEINKSLALVDKSWHPEK